MSFPDPVKIQTCHDENCPYNNYRDLKAMLEKIGSEDLELQTVRCLNLCRFEREGTGIPPFVKFQDRIFSDLTESRLSEIISGLTGEQAS